MDKLEELKIALEETRNGLSTDRLDMSFGEIMSMYERDEIVIDPDFQDFFDGMTTKKQGLLSLF